MNKKEYAEYLESLVDEIEIDSESDDLSEEFYAYFQCFMPDGKNVEKVFAHLEYGQDLLQRILPIYEIMKDKTMQQFSEGISPGYFCPEPSGNEELLEKIGKQHVENLKLFADYLDDAELKDLLGNVTEIVILENETELTDDYLDTYLNDVLLDWAMENEDDEELISILTEAYYSIANDYSLSYYLRYPAFNEKPGQDFLKAYFEIWKEGYHCKLDKDKLIIYK